MRRFVPAAVLAACVLGVSACGSNSTSTANPSGPTPAPPDPVVIDIVGIKGSLSFSPNPATVPAGRLIVWRNVDTTTHRVVFNDGEVDSGDIQPGASSQPTGIAAPGPYHCSIHPPMVGAVSAQ
jgi:plastocyanin